MIATSISLNSETNYFQEISFKQKHTALFNTAHITTHKTSVHSSHLSALWATSHAHLRPGHSSRSETQLGCRISGSGGEATGTDHQALPSGRASLPRGPTLDMRAQHDEHTIKDSASQDPAKDDRRCLPTGHLPPLERGWT